MLLLLSIANVAVVSTIAYYWFNLSLELLIWFTALQFSTALVLIILAVEIVKNYHTKLIWLITEFIAAHKENKSPELAHKIHDTITANTELGILAHTFADDIANPIVVASVPVKQEELKQTNIYDKVTSLPTKYVLDTVFNSIRWKLNFDISKYGFLKAKIDNLNDIDHNFTVEKGNVAVKGLCSILKSIYTNSVLFRISNDTLILFLQGKDVTNSGKLLHLLNKHLSEIKNSENIKPWEKIIVSVKMSIYNPVYDKSVDDVFKRVESNSDAS